MWQTDISIDRSFQLKHNIDRYLKGIGVNYTSADIGSRNVFSVAEYNENKVMKLRNAISKLLIVDMKYNYFKGYIDMDCATGTRLLLVGEMLFFDNLYEKDYMKDILSLQYEYSLDGILNFKMAKLRENWDYLIELYRKVSNDDDMLLLAKYMHESAEKDGKKIYLTRKSGNAYVFDMTTGEKYDNVNIFASEPKNTLFTILSTHTSHLYVENNYKFDIDTELINNVLHVEIV